LRDRPLTGMAYLKDTRDRPLTRTDAYQKPLAADFAKRDLISVKRDL
jgi:hypothetical protein